MCSHHREIVRDEQVGQAEPLLQVLQQVDDLRLDRHVERRDRLVADDELGLDGQRAGDADALALAAGELVRDSAARCVGAQADQVRAARRPRCRARGRRRRCRGRSSGSADDLAARVMRGLSEANGSWKTICMRRRSVPQLLAGRAS